MGRCMQGRSHAGTWKSEPFQLTYPCPCTA